MKSLWRTARLTTWGAAIRLIKYRGADSYVGL